MNDYLFKENRLRVLASSLLELLVHEAHEGGLIGHFEVTKTLDVLHEHFYWQRWKGMCNKSVTPLSVPTKPWVDISIDFV